jgi:hypothetical protein
VNAQVDPAAQARLVGTYGKLPLSFEANRGQTQGQVKIFSRGPGYALYLTKDGAVLALSRGSQKSIRQLTDKGQKTNVEDREARTRSPLDNSGLSTQSSAPAFLRMKLMEADPHAKVVGMDELPGKSNYFIGNDPKKWRTNVPNYGKVKYSGVFPGIDLVYYGNQRQLEYDFVVSPAAGLSVPWKEHGRLPAAQDPPEIQSPTRPRSRNLCVRCLASPKMIVKEES